jgi:hypothetical protein
MELRILANRFLCSGTKGAVSFILTQKDVEIRSTYNDLGLQRSKSTVISK